MMASMVAFLGALMAALDVALMGTLIVALMMVLGTSCLSFVKIRSVKISYQALA